MSDQNFDLEVSVPKLNEVIRAYGNKQKRR